MLFRPAIDVEPAKLSAAFRAELAPLRGARPLAFSLQLVRVWLVIVTAIVAAEWIGTWWSRLLAVLIVAIRQSMLMLLGHEQVHLVAYRHRYGDLLVNLFCAYPLMFVTIEGYAQVHLAHHRYYFSDRDPDQQRKSGPDWAFPMPWSRLLRIFARDASGLNIIQLVRGKRLPGPARFQRPGVHPRWSRPLFYLLLAAVLTATGGWGLFLLYWILPLLTVLQLIIRWGAMCEHEYNQHGARMEDTTPIIVLPWWQRLLLPNMGITMHVHHHHHPNVSYSNLGRVHRLYRQHGLLDEAAVFNGYGAYLRHLQRGGRDARRSSQ